jgi:hypothetical protein
MWKNPMTVLAAWVGICAVVTLIPGRSADHPRPVARTEVVTEPPADVLAIDERWAKKEQVIARLVAGVARLAEAAEDVIALNRAWPVIPPKRYEFYPGWSLKARVARMLIGAVAVRVAAADPQRDEIIKRLTDELNDIDAAGGRSAAD